MIRLMSEIINCFFKMEFNAKQTKHYLANEKNRNISINLLNEIFKEFR